MQNVYTVPSFVETRYLCQFCLRRGRVLSQRNCGHCPVAIVCVEKHGDYQTVTKHKHSLDLPLLQRKN